MITSFSFGWQIRFNPNLDGGAPGELMDLFRPFGLQSNDRMAIKLPQTIFKTCDTSNPNKYRPISLLSLGYKSFASRILNRLLSAGVDERLSKYQLGFRKGRSRQYAICIVRRRIEQAWAPEN